MYRNNRKSMIRMAIFFLAAVSLSACGFTTDTGSGNREIPKEEYLMQEALINREEQSAADFYQVYTLEKGIYTDEIKKQTLQNVQSSLPRVRYQLQKMPARFGEYVAKYAQYVETGDVIAVVYPEAEEAAILEARLKVQRLEENESGAQEVLERDLQEIEESKMYLYNYYKESILNTQATQKRQEREWERYHDEKELAKARQHLKRLQTAGKVYEIKADRAGYVIYNTKYPEGTVLQPGDVICDILSADAIYEAAELPGELFPYGTQGNLQVKSGAIKGRVVSGDTKMLYGNLDKGLTVFRADLDEIAEEKFPEFVKGATLEAGAVRTVENVLLIPRKAVTEEDGQFFVTVLKEDGGLLKTEFLPGGGNAQWYWVLEGLSEGMQIVFR